MKPIKIKNTWMLFTWALAGLAVVSTTAHASRNTKFVIQELVAAGAIDTATLSRKLTDVSGLLTRQITLIQAYQNLPGSEQTEQKEIELRAALKFIAGQAASQLAIEKRSTLKGGNFVEKKLALPKIAEAESSLATIDSWISEGDYARVSAKASALRNEVAEAGAALQ